MYPTELEIKDTTESNAYASFLDLLLLMDRDGYLRTSQHNIIARLCRFYLTTHPTRQGLLLLWMFYSEGGATFQIASRSVIYKGTFEIVYKEVLWSVTGFYQTIWGSLLPNVTHHSGGWPCTVTPSIDKTLHQLLTLLLIFDFLPNCARFRFATGAATFATGAACQQRTLTPPDTWSCPILGLVWVLMLRPISSEHVLFRTFEFRTSLGTSVLLWIKGYCVLVEGSSFSSFIDIRHQLKLIDLWDFSLLITQNCTYTTFIHTENITWKYGRVSRRKMVEFICVLRQMQRYFSHICDGTDVQADWRRSCTYGLGSQRHRHFAGFFNVPVIHRHVTNLFIRWFRHPPFSRLLRRKMVFQKQNVQLSLKSVCNNCVCEIFVTSWVLSCVLVFVFSGLSVILLDQMCLPT